MSDSVLYDVADAVATVTLNRPDAMNSLNTETKDALRDAVQRAADDTGVRAVILTGSGRAFCVGQDLKEHIDNVQNNPDAVWNTVPDHYNPIALALTTMPKPVVAADRMHETAISAVSPMMARRRSRRRMRTVAAGLSRGSQWSVRRTTPSRAVTARSRCTRTARVTGGGRRYQRERARLANVIPRTLRVR